jgi:hypothetical protein
MKDCPECSTPVDGMTCPKCGYTEDPSSNAKNSSGDWWRCAHAYVGGERCDKPGSLSSSTHGTGPWYCHEHFPPFMKWNQVQRSEPPGGFDALKEVLRKNRPPNDGQLIE